MILVTGGAGFVGKALIKRLLADTFSVRAVVRSNPKQISECDVALVADINSSTDWTSILSGVDVVIHTAARVHVMEDNSVDPLSEFRKVNVEGTLHLAKQAASNGVKRFIFISSIKVNGESTTDRTPFRANDLPSPSDPYGISKMEAEALLLDLASNSGMEVVIIRPPLVYGVGVKANFQLMMNWIKKGFPWPFRPEKNKRSLVYIENLTDLIVRCIDHPGAINNIFLVSDDDDLSTAQLLRGLSKAMNRQTYLLPTPIKAIELLAKLTGKVNVIQRLFGSLQVDIAETKQKLEWHPPITVEEGFRRTVQNSEKN